MLARGLRRVVQSAGLLLLISTLWFLALSMAPGDYFDEARLNPTTSVETIARLRGAYGLSQPLPIRYGRWLWSLAHGDLGQSMVYNQPVSTLLAPRVANTLVLTGTSLILSWMLALAFGVWAGSRENGPTDRVLRGISGILLAIPELIVATLLVYWAARSGRFPTGGMLSGSGGLRDLAFHLALPTAVLTAAAFPVLFRHVRLAVKETLKEPFVRMAVSLGISPGRLWWQYVLRAAANPLLSLLGLSLAALLSSSMLVEVIFGWPGLGPLFLESLFARDTYVLLAAVVLSSLLLLGGNLAADFLLLWNDPRIRKAGQ
jgi:peptide/nickel transport system permease protein